MGRIYLKSRDQIAAIRESCHLVIQTLIHVGTFLEEGITTLEINREIERTINGFGGTPAFKGYRGFPAASCISVNDVIVHGIPDSHKLAAGELVSIDIGVLYNGYYGDAAYTFPIGAIGPREQQLLDATWNALHLGIEQATVGNRIGDIAHAIQRHVEGATFSVVRDLVGHGVGLELHEEPQVPNYGKPARGVRLKPGMVIAIEPMVNMGDKATTTDDDEWTVRTADGSPSAHYEHTVAITESGPQILTEGLHRCRNSHT